MVYKQGSSELGFGKDASGGKGVAMYWGLGVLFPALTSSV